MPLPPLVDPAPPLTPAERERYARHVLVPAIGDAGQRRLRAARVLVIGAGGLGSPVLLYLAAAGVGTLGLVDDDAVDLTNLQRQVIHDTAAVGTPKVASAAARVRALNPGVTVTEHAERLTASNAHDLLGGYDLVVDATDNFPTRYVVNDACAALGLPFVWAAIYRTDAQVSLFWKNPPAGADTPGVDLRDIFPAPPDPALVPSCGDAGVLGALCGQVGSMMAIEAVKLLCGVGRPLLGRVLFLDTLATTITELPLRPRADDGTPPASSAGASGEPPVVPEISPRELASLLDAGRAPRLIDVREPAECDLGMLPGATAMPLAGFLADPPDVAPGEEVVVYCKGGVRSARAAKALLARGPARVRSLAGGILAWRDEVDPSLPRY